MLDSTPSSQGLCTTLELKPEQAHPGVVLWAWATLYLVRERLPRRRVLVRFDYPTLSGPGSRGWLLIEKGDAEICEKYPGGEEDLIVVGRRTALRSDRDHRSSPE
jgi:hypothetical protein